jgi:hypothetical protein
VHTTNEYYFSENTFINLTSSRKAGTMHNTGGKISSMREKVQLVIDVHPSKSLYLSQIRNWHIFCERDTFKFQFNTGRYINTNYLYALEQCTQHVTTLTCEYHRHKHIILTIATIPPSVFSFSELTATFMKHNSSDKRKPIRKLIKARVCQHCPKVKTARTGVEN